MEMFIESIGDLKGYAKKLLTLQAIGQSAWMDHVGRERIHDGSLLHHIEDRSITGISFSFQAVSQTLGRSKVYDRAILKRIQEGICGEPLAVDLILEDVRYAADLVRHVFDKTDGVDGWVTFPALPVNMSNLEELTKSVIDLHAKIRRPNVLITVPGFPEYLELIEQLVFAGFPINISFICSHDQYINAAESYLRAIEKRINEGLNPAVTVFVSISTSYLAEALSKEITQDAASQVIIAAARKIYRAMRILHTSQKWERAYNGGARIMRIIWVNSGEKQTPDCEHFLINNLIAPLTVTSISANVLKDFSHCDQFQTLMPENGDDCDDVLARSEETGINFEHLATCLQKDLAEYQITDWIMLLDALARRSASIIQNQNSRTEGEQR